MQGLEKIMEEIESEALHNSEIGRKQCEGMAIAMNIIRKHMNDGWIPVEERLPEYNESGFYDAVNVTMKNGSVTHGCYRNYDEEWWVASKDGEFKYTQSSEVIAWSPLPEPYHSERSNTMTENEAISRIKDHMEIHRLKEPRAIYITVALSMAIAALKEIQQYREIGTVEECKELAYIVNIAEKEELAKIIDEWLLYSKIGTVEECREAVEKQKAKAVMNGKLLKNFHGNPYCIKGDCPTCARESIKSTDTDYCYVCGQHLKWDENLDGMKESEEE